MHDWLEYHCPACGAVKAPVSVTMGVCKDVCDAYFYKDGVYDEYCIGTEFTADTKFSFCCAKCDKVIVAPTTDSHAAYLEMKKILEEQNGLRT